MVPVNDSIRSKRWRRLNVLRHDVSSKGGVVRTDLIVLVSKNGVVTLAQWDGAEIQKIDPPTLISENKKEDSEHTL